jgi:hypothetical protein
MAALNTASFDKKRKLVEFNRKRALCVIQGALLLFYLISSFSDIVLAIKSSTVVKENPLPRS